MPVDWADGERCELQVQVESDPVTVVPVPAELQLAVIVWTQLVDTHLYWIHICGTAPVTGQLHRSRHRGLDWAGGPDLLHVTWTKT